MRFLLLALSTVLSLPAWAQDYPAREIRSICNFAAGSGADIIVRYFGDKLSKLAGKPVIVENKPGANGLLASSELARAAPDGYNIMITPVTSTIISAPYLFKSVPFDPLKDFAPVSTLAVLSFVIVVDASKPYKTVQDLVTSLKQKQGHGFYGTSNNTGVIVAELFKAKAGLQTTYTPYKANPQALADLLQGQLDFLAYDATWSIGQAKGGRVRILATASPKRSQSMPSVPTLAESGYGGDDVMPMWGVVVPAATPKPVIAKLSRWFNDILDDDDARQFLIRNGYEPLPGTPEQMAALMASEAVRWKRYVETAKIEPQ